MTGEVRREHWTVPVCDPDGAAQVIAHRDGTVSLYLSCGDSRTTVRLGVCQAAQLCTGIWEAAGAAQYLCGHPGEDQPPPAPPPDGSGDLPEAWRVHPRRRASPRARATRRRRRPTRANQDAAMDATHTIGLRLRRIRQARGKSLQVISGLAGMSSATLHHVEYGRRELTVSEIVALADALEIDPWKLIRLPTPPPRLGEVRVIGAAGPASPGS